MVKKKNLIFQIDCTNSINHIIYYPCRFVPDKEFSGTDRTGAGRSAGPVQFEKEEEDPFGLDQFLNQAKRGGAQSTKRPAPKDDRSYDKKKRRD